MRNMVGNARRVMAASVVLATVIGTGVVPAVNAATRPAVVAGQARERTPVRLAAGHQHTCVVLGDGTVRCWGQNFLGMLGDGTTDTRRLPVRAGTLTGVVAVTAAVEHSCALRSDGTAWCWGQNATGQLGNGNSGDHSTLPVQVSGLTDAVAIDAGSSHTCALRVGGTVQCWGANFDGQLGDGTFDHHFTPVTASGLTNAVAISVGFRFSCALLADGTVRCWGDGADGALGDGTLNDRPTPGPVSNLSTAVALAAGGANACALVVGGTVRCWGFNRDGELGNGTFDASSVPVNVRSLTNAVSLGAGSIHMCALRSTGTAACWGQNLSGELGDGTNVDQNQPVSVAGLSGATTIVGGGAGYSCALMADGTVRCWGSNFGGYLGNGGSTNSPTPTPVSNIAGSISARSVALGSLHTCALRSTGITACWGINENGQVGDGSSVTMRLSPAAVGGLTGATAITAGDLHTCALIAAGTARCWGFNGQGRLGDQTTTDRRLPVAVTGLSQAVAIDAGGSHTCALIFDGTLRCWGAGESGQLGVNDRNDHLQPVTPANISDAVAIAAGGFHTCALRQGGAIRCWGENGNGQLGDGTTQDRLQAVNVSGITNAIAISAGAAHTCAVLADGTARCWGLASDGRLGDNSTSGNASLPRTVSALTITGIAAGGQHSCALIVSGGAGCWGDGSSGQLGDGGTTDRPTPVTVSRAGGFSDPLVGLAQIGAGGLHSCATAADGAVFCWGNNDFGQLGDGTVTRRPRAVAVPSFTLNIDPAVNLRASGRLVTVTIIATCAAGARLHVEVALTQGAVSGAGVGEFSCAAAVERYPVVVAAHGSAGFVAGAATVSAHAEIRDHGTIIDTQDWTRAVTISGP